MQKESIVCTLTGVEIVGYGKKDLFNNYVARLIQVNGFKKADAESHANAVIFGNTKIEKVAPVIVEKKEEPTKELPKNLKDKIKDFVSDITDDGKRNYSNRKKKK